MMHRNKSVNVHSFAMIPKAEIPRSAFRMQHSLKSSFNAGLLIPIYVDEMLPGDTFNMRMTAFCRLATPIFPVMDNLHFETFFFFVPNRLVWDNWVRFMGERPDPDSSVDFTVPIVPSPIGGALKNTIYDYFGIPGEGQIGGGNTIDANSLPFRAYNLIWNEWFRDQNLQDSLDVPKDDGPDSDGDFALQRRGKRHDYFTGCLPFPQKGTAVSIPLTGNAPIVSTGQLITFNNDADTRTAGLRMTTGTNVPTWSNSDAAATSDATFGVDGTLVGSLEANLSSVTAATINTLRLSFQVQKLLERDARGGTRYTEIVRSHFGVISPDARMQRPEYLGGGSTPIVINPIAQTSGTDITGSDTPQGNLAAVGTGLAAGHGFTYSATEHGYVIGLCNVRADLTYQQGIRRLWNRRTRYDFYFPVFAALGEQGVLNKEIYATGGAADTDVFGYQERWAEYRYFPSLITGLMRSTAVPSIDAWHYSQEFGSLPVLDDQFITDRTDDVVQRTTAVGSSAEGQQFLLDCFFDNRAARPMPLYSVPGLIDHF